MLTAFIILFLIFLLLIIPVEFVFNYKNFENPVKKVILSWFFGIISFEVNPIKASSKEKKEVKPHSENKKGPGFSKIRKILGNSKFTGKTYNTVRRFLSSAKPKLNRFYLKIGLGDPADTGLLWGLIGPLSGILYGYADKDLVIEPDFLDPAFDVETEGKITIIPLEMLYIAFSYIFSPVVIKTYWFDLRGTS